MDCSLPGSSVHGILQARTLEWVAIPFSNIIYIGDGQGVLACCCLWGRKESDVTELNWCFYYRNPFSFLLLLSWTYLSRCSDCCWQGFPSGNGFSMAVNTPVVTSGFRSKLLGLNLHPTLCFKLSSWVRPYTKPQAAAAADPIKAEIPHLKRNIPSRMLNKTLAVYLGA